MRARTLMIVAFLLLGFGGPDALARPCVDDDGEWARSMVRGRRWDELEREMRRFARERTSNENGRRRLHACHDGLADLTSEADRALVGEWRAARPESSIVLTVLGKIALTRAWEARGSEMADKVTEDGARLFDERLTEARDLLERAAALGRDDPEPITALFSVAMAQGWPLEQRQRWLNKALAIDPADDIAASAFMTGLLGKWGGSDQMALDFARHVVATAPPHSRFPELILLVHHQLDQSSNDDHYFKREDVKAEVDAALAQLVTDFPRSQWIRFVAAWVALRNGDVKAAKTNLDAAGTCYFEGFFDSEAAYQEMKRRVDVAVTPKSQRPQTPKTAPQARRDGSLLPTSVELIDAGAEPRAPLRLRLTAGASRITRLTIDGTHSESATRGQQRLGSQVLAIRPELVTVSAVVREVATDGLATIDLTILDTSLGEAIVRRSVETPPEVLATMAGATGRVVLDDRGNAHELAFGAPPDTPASLRLEWQRLAQPWIMWCLPFPEAAVGKGGRWRVTGSWWLEGDILDIDQQCELRERSGDSLTIAADGYSAGGRKRIRVDGVPTDTSCEMASHSVITWADVVLDLGRPLTTSASTWLDSRRHVCIGDAHVESNVIVITKRRLGLSWTEVTDSPAAPRATWDASRPAPEVEDRLVVAVPIASVEAEDPLSSGSTLRVALAVVGVGLLTLLLIRVRRGRSPSARESR